MHGSTPPVVSVVDPPVDPVDPLVPDEVSLVDPDVVLPADADADPEPPLLPSVVDDASLVAVVADVDAVVLADVIAVVADVPLPSSPLQPTSATLTSAPTSFTGSSF